MAEPGITEPEPDAVKENTDSKSDRVETMAESLQAWASAAGAAALLPPGALIISELFRFGGRLPEAGLSGYEVTGGAQTAANRISGASNSIRRSRRRRKQKVKDSWNRVGYLNGGRRISQMYIMSAVK